MTVWLQRVPGDARAQARRLLRHVAATSLGVPHEHIDLTAEPGGRPVIAVRRHGDPMPGRDDAGRDDAGHDDAMHVGLSHSGGVVAVVVSRLGPVGVDVERLRSLPALALARRWLAPAEADWLGGIPVDQQAAAFLLLWTQKEAVGKALGTGLRNGGMRRVMPAAVGGSCELRPVPGLASMAVAGCAVGPDLMLALACQSAAGQAFDVRELAPDDPLP